MLPGTGPATLPPSPPDEPAASQSLATPDAIVAVEHEEGVQHAQPETDALSLFPEEEESKAPALESSVTAPRAVDTMAQPERTATAFETENNRLESGLVKASRLDEQVSALEARIRKFTEPDQPLACGETMVNRLQQRAVDTQAQLEGTVAAFTAQKNTIASGLGEAARLAELVSGLEKRIARLTGKGQLLGDADTLVGHLEQRAVRTTAKLEQVARATGKLGDDLERLHDAVRTAIESARKQVAELAGHTKRPRFANSLRGLNPRAAGGAVVGGLSVLVVAGVIVARAHKPAPISITSPRAQGPLSPGSSPVPPNSVLTPPVATQIPTDPSTLTTQHGVSGAPFTKTPIPSPESTPVTIESEPGTSRTRKIATDQHSRTAKPQSDPAQRPAFTGNLSVQSNPVGAAVFIDHQYVGETPLQLTNVRAGSHVLWIEHEGHERWTAAALVTADKQVQVNANLQPER